MLPLKTFSEGVLVTGTQRYLFAWAGKKTSYSLPRLETIGITLYTDRLCLLKVHFQSPTSVSGWCWWWLSLLKEACDCLLNWWWHKCCSFLVCRRGHSRNRLKASASRDSASNTALCFNMLILSVETYLVSNLGSTSEAMSNRSLVAGSAYFVLREFTMVFLMDLVSLLSPALFWKD